MGVAGNQDTEGGAAEANRRVTFSPAYPCLAALAYDLEQAEKLFALLSDRAKFDFEDEEHLEELTWTAEALEALRRARAIADRAATRLAARGLTRHIP